MGKLIKLIPHIQWLNGRIVKIPSDQENLLVVTNPALTVVEGISAFRTSLGVTKAWLLDDHLQRLKESIKILGLKLEININDFKQGIQHLIEQANQEEVYLKIVIVPRADGTFDQHILMEKYIFGPLTKTLNTSLLQRGYPHFNMQVKTLGNQQIQDIAKIEADLKRVNDLLIFDNYGYVTGTSCENLFVIKNGIALTPPNDGSILPGLTRRIISLILSDPNIMFGMYQRPTMPVIEKKITIADLYSADEVFLTSTKHGIVSVRFIDGRKIGDNTPYTKLLTEVYYKLVKEEIKL